MSNDGAPKKDGREQIENLQKRFDSLLEKRNELNDLSRQLRQERNLLNDGTKEFRDRIEQAKKNRDYANAKMKEAKAKRNELQAQAKALIASKKAKGGEFSKSLPLQVRQLEKEIRDMETKHETQPMGIEAERNLLKALKEKQVEVDALKAKMEENRAVKVDLDDLDGSIDSLFQAADDEHKLVQKWHEEGNKFHAAFVEALEETKVLRKEANSKHQEYIAVREKADEQHNNAMELREQLLAIRGEQRAEREKSRAEIRDFNEQARQALNDPNKREEMEEDAISALKSGGKISLGV